MLSRSIRLPRSIAFPLVLVAAASATASAASAAAVTADPVLAAVERPGVPDAVIRIPAPSHHGAYVAKLLRRSVVRARPADRARRVAVAGDRTDYLDQGNRLMVLAARYDADGEPWLRVQLPVRPNETAGWIRADDAVLDRTRWAVRVRLNDRRLTVYHRGRAVRTARVVVGAAATPTPRGTFAVYEVAPQVDRAGFTGPWALNLTGFSTVLENFGSGPGRVAIHGRAGASLADPLGTARSHGCVRVDNRLIDWMRQRLANGTPVRITL